MIIPRSNLCRRRLVRMIASGLAPELAWTRLQAIAGAYQRENDIMFLGLPALERQAMIDWLEALD